MYSNLQQKQAQNDGNYLLSAAFGQKTGKIDPKYTGDIDAYLETCTKTQRSIAHMFLSFRYAPHIQISNDYVAATIHCSIKTVTRATNKFHLDGFLLKQQPNQYAFNNYQFHPLTRKGKGSFNYWFNSLSPENQLSYKTDRSYVNHKGEKKFSLRNVPQNRITLVITKPIDERYLNARVREAEIDGDGFGFLTEIEKSRKERTVKGIEMLKDLQKQWVLKHKNEPAMKEFLETEPVKAALFTPAIEKITALLDLNDRERFKLVAFPDNVVEYALSYVQPVVEGKTVLKTPVKDRMGWLMGIVIGFCNKHKIKPDWKWYFELCEITGIQHIPKDEKPIPLKVKKPERNSKNIGHSPYDPYVSPVLEPIDVRIAKLKKEIENFSAQIAEPERFFKSHLFRDSNVLFAQNALTRCITELTELESECQFVTNPHELSDIAMS